MCINSVKSLGVPTAATAPSVNMCGLNVTKTADNLNIVAILEQVKQKSDLYSKPREE